MANSQKHPLSNPTLKLIAFFFFFQKKNRGGGAPVGPPPPPRPSLGLPGHYSLATRARCRFQLPILSLGQHFFNNLCVISTMVTWSDVIYSELMVTIVGAFIFCPRPGGEMERVYKLEQRELCPHTSRYFSTFTGISTSPPPLELKKGG